MTVDVVLKQLTAFDGLRDSKKLRFDFFSNVPQKMWTVKLVTALLQQSPKKGDWVQHVNPDSWTQDILDVLLASKVDVADFVPFVPDRFRTDSVQSLLRQKFGVSFDFMPRSLSRAQMLLATYAKSKT